MTTVRLIRLTRTQLIEDRETQEALQAAPLIFCDDETIRGELANLGISSHILENEGVPDGATVVLSKGALYDLVYVADRLLGPGGCPWDQAQTHESLKRYMLEETYEAFEAIDSGSNEKLKEELGDVLLQPIMHAEMKSLAGEFDIEDVAEAIVEKLVRRHPHVFGTVQAETADDVLRNWDAIKRKEKGDEPASILAGVPKAMPALLRAYEVSKRAVRAGFEWPGIESVFEKLREEESELKDALRSGSASEIEHEIGDLLFTAVNIARWAKVEPEEALRKMLDRFTDRFTAMENAAKKPLEDLTLQEWDELWELAKSANSP